MFRRFQIVRFPAEGEGGSGGGSSPSAPAPAAPSAPSPAPSAPSAPSAPAPAAASGTPGAAPAGDGMLPPAYTPNLKFKVLNEEKEFDPLFKDLVKDADSEKKIRELHERAFGLDHVKSKNQEMKAQLADIAPKFQGLTGQIKEIGADVQKGDLTSLLQAFKVTDDMLFSYAKQKLDYLQLPEEQRRAYDSQREERQRLRDLERQNQSYQQMAATYAAQARDAELTHAVANPVVTEALKALPPALQSPEVFRAEVLRYAQWTALTSGRDLTAQQAVAEVLQRWGAQIGSAGAPAGATLAQPAPAAPAPTQQTPPPTIPNVTGRTTTPVKKVPGTLKDLQKLRQERMS